MTMLEKGTCLQWRPLVYSDLPTYVIMLIDVLIGRWQKPDQIPSFGRCAFTELKKSPFAVSI